VVKRFWFSLGFLAFMGVSFTAATASVSPANAAACFSSFTNKTTANGLGNNVVLGVYVDGSNVYAATLGGLAISTNGGTSFDNRTVANATLGNNQVNGVYVDGSNVYGATNGGVSISADCVSSSPPPTEGGAPAQVKAPTLAETGPDLSLVLVGSGVSALMLFVGAAAILASRRKLARN
jgi:hypothetical protein